MLLCAANSLLTWARGATGSELCAIDVEHGETDSVMGFEDVLDNVTERDDTGAVVGEGFAGWLGKDQRYFEKLVHSLSRLTSRDICYYVTG